MTSVRLLIFGSRKWVDDLPIRWLLLGLQEDDVLVCGMAPNGADDIAYRLATLRQTLVDKYPADWNRYGKGAGPVRNQQMLDEGKPDIAFGFTDDIENSRGTADMKRRCHDAGVPVYMVSHG